MEEEGEVFTFGPYKKDRREVFYSTPLSYALVNLRPVLPGTSFSYLDFASLISLHPLALPLINLLFYSQYYTTLPMNLVPPVLIV
jgi:hypothetical protein